MARSSDGLCRKKPAKVPGISVVERSDATGPYWVFVVRWKNPTTGKKEAETCYSLQEAQDFKAQLRLLRRRGALPDLDRGRETLDVHAAEWLERHAKHHLEHDTLKGYVGTYNRHLHPRIGHLELRQIRPKVVDQLRTELLADKVGPPTVRKALAILSAMLTHAVLWDRLDANPVREVRKPPAKRTKVIEPLSVLQVERLLHELRAIGDHDGACLVELLAYTGARPQDALAMTYEAVGRRIHLTHKVVNGVRIPGSKTGADRTRTVEALPTLRRMLLARQAATAKATPTSLILSEADGSPWSSHTYKNWSHRQPRGRKKKDGTRAGSPGLFVRAAQAVGLPPSVTPYYLRHTYASLRIAEQRLSLKEVAEEMGHSVQVLSDTYAHTIQEYAGRGPIDPDELIREARAEIALGPRGLQEDSTSGGAQGA